MTSALVDVWRNGIYVVDCILFVAVQCWSYATIMQVTRWSCQNPLSWKPKKPWTSWQASVDGGIISNSAFRTLGTTCESKRPKPFNCRIDTLRQENKLSFRITSATSNNEVLVSTLVIRVDPDPGPIVGSLISTTQHNTTLAESGSNFGAKVGFTYNF